MAESERYRDMMLDNIYGLLDAEQAIELEVFLATTSEGERLRAQGDIWKRQIAQAAKVDFPQVKFAAPAKAAKPMRYQVKAPANASRPPSRSNEAIGLAISWPGQPWQFFAASASR